MPLPQKFADFDIPNAGVTVWLFKKSGGAGGVAPVFTGHWIATTDELEAALKEAIAEARDAIEEVNPYNLLAQNNEASVLNIGTLETHADRIVAASADALQQRKVRNLRQIQNTDFYVIKLTSGGDVLHAVRKTDASWRSSRRGNYIDVLFRDEGLELDDAPQFSLSKYVDFFIVDDQILIKEKNKFESIVSYRQAHENDFAELQAEPLFAGLFTDLAPLVAFVGTNKIQLRRICAIRQKGHYQDQAFMARLRQHHAEYQLNLVFDANGRIQPTDETCSDIITALLDHRLSSAFSENVYNVPDATQVN
ncbi:Kiwa anti-phage protein KwaB-like domain-containing protein [Novosphingobium subterraneum]|uniref:DUF4868 domain-containing protein n=1 Tax=Novosphingobium subterraneum TaxID=48936 RepID=A0A0B9A914_9SPHN|nr:Kiwa anti-phage protein KwaB-like domain-containing protein [Novosphingobium subterraneum]KHS45852.1 hypothetical protein NJ75_02457 [Novosphingobium subterraneum]